MKRFRLTYFLLLALSASMIGFTGCSQDEYVEKQTTNQPQIEAKLILALRMPTANTRTETTTLPGTSAENKCSKLTLFIMNEDGSNIQDYTISGDDLASESLIFNLETTEGRKKILIAANMGDNDINNIKSTAGNNPVQTIEQIANVTENNKFLMTGQAVTTEGGNPIIDIKAGSITQVTAALTRVVSKVLLTCQTDAQGYYVNLSSSSKGYIRLENVHYALDKTNRKYYPFEKTGNEDPNYSMTETLGQTGNFFDFAGDLTTCTVATKADASRLISGGTSPYNEGIYCLENTVKTDYNYGNDLSIPKQVATYLKIAAKFTPSSIDGEEGLPEAVAINKLQNGTFYTCKKAPSNKKQMCYSSIAKGIEYLGAGFSEADFVEHKGGWQYFETFIASPTAFTEASSLKRNNYYIANITSITVPVQEKTIEVNTTIAAWEMKGRTTIDIETSK